MEKLGLKNAFGKGTTDALYSIPLWRFNFFVVLILCKCDARMVHLERRATVFGKTLPFDIVQYVHLNIHHTCV
jgi:hypothetical protein